MIGLTASANQTKSNPVLNGSYRRVSREVRLSIQFL
jgi:hypothetical protein